MSDPPLLDIQDLVIRYEKRKGAVCAVEGLNLRLERGKTLGFVGETGAGKTTAALGIMRLLPEPPGKIVSGRILFNGENLLDKSEDEMRSIRGGKIAMIFQDPMTSLNPVATIGDQITEMISLHSDLSRRDSIRKASDMLDLVGIRRERAGDYPHQLSGGMKQRVVIAIALACSPELLIADEPTTALDVTIQAQVLDLMKGLKEAFSTSLLMISHDLGIVAEFCDDTAIMYAGRVVEYASTAELFGNPIHPYTRGLFGSIPSITGGKGDLRTIPGLTPDASNLPPGCPFQPRCDIAGPECSKEAPRPTEVKFGHYCLCHLNRGENQP
ncbi:MAG: ABC transporter ATP-binding protein [Synergistaceae bacterium]|jgi:peptide/nickel transport system ATP-binding protein|nr:ABC transporter ATP-binding protein [Synergistaceae bacterium]